jgi:CHAT domain-containing protein
MSRKAIFILLVALWACGPIGAIATHDSLRVVAFQEEIVQQFADHCPEEAWEVFWHMREFTRRQDALGAYLEAGKGAAYQARNAMKRPELADELYRKTAEGLWRRPNREVEWKSLGWLLVNAGYNQVYRLGRFQSATPYYEHALHLFADTLGWKTTQVDGFVKRELANLYTRQGEYPSAELLLNEILENSLAQQAFGMAADVCNDLGLLYTSLGQTDKALAIYERGLAIPAEELTARGLIRMNQSQALAEARPREALACALAAADIFAKQPATAEYPLAPAYLGMSLSHAAAACVRLGEYPRAMAYNEEAEARLIAFYGHHRRREVGKVYVSNGKLYQAMNCAEEALGWYQRALQSVLYAYRPATPDALPSIDMIYAENTILDALAGMAELYARQDNTTSLERALDCYRLTYEVEKQLRRQHLYEQSRLFALEESYERTEAAIATAVKLYNRTGDKAQAEAAFAFAERGKSILLLESVRAGSAGLSHADREHETALQEAVAKAERNLYEAGAEDAPDSLLHVLEGELLRARAAHVRWTEALADRNPDYYRRRYSDALAGVAEVQAMLQPNQAMLAYFAGQDKLYTFIINAAGLTVLAAPSPAQLSGRIQAFVYSIEAFQQPGANRQALCEQYTREARQLYQELVAPAERAVKLPARLVIIPGGALSLLPFDALLTAAPTEACQFKRYPYLLHRYEIGMGYSATLQYTLYQTERGQGGFAGFAPRFDGSGGWPRLACSASQLYRIAQSMDGEVFEGEEATIGAFKQRAGNYGVLHLATHAQANTARGNFSFIVFNKPDGGYDTLYVNDFHDLQLAAELITLSACQTADGEAYRSEGVISLSRGLLQAGARSVVSTLWQVNESASCALAGHFYEELRAGRRKSEALAIAKRAYLTGSDPMSAHPVYWAAYHLSGNDRPLRRPLSWAWMFLLAPVAWLGWRFISRLPKRKDEQPAWNNQHRMA